ncbi:MAG TPA: tryptophan 7-halogenase [Acetobacteraceae bacterium]|nr:tryptophan 7-halogenase [Acetobacteraceae bacterium]
MPPIAASCCCDVIVIGAGPAGTAAASVLARAGRQTLILARTGQERPRPRETAPVALASLLAAIGVAGTDLARFAQPCPWRGEDAHPACLQIDRAGLSVALLAAAKRAGALVIPARASAIRFETAQDPVHVTLEDGRVLAAAMLIDASGARQVIRRALRLHRRRLSPPLLAWRGEVAAALEGARFETLSDGWLFLAGADGRTSWTSLRHSAGPAPVEGRDILPPTAWDVGWYLVRPVAGPDWRLAGEAGGRLDPAWGQGLCFAVASGIAAARSSLATQATPAAAALLAATYDGWFADRLLEAAATLRTRYAAAGIALGLPPQQAGRPLRRREQAHG